MTHGWQPRDWAPDDEPEPPRRVPQPPPPARHVAGGGGMGGGASGGGVGGAGAGGTVPPTPYPSSPPPMPMSPPPGPRRPPPNNAAGLPPAYPPGPPPIPTSPSVPRSPGGPGPMFPPGGRLPGPGPRGPAGPMPGPRGRTPAPRRGLAPGRQAKRRPTLPPLPKTAGVGFGGLLRQLPQHKPWMITISVISVLVVLGACGFGSFQLLRQEGDPVGIISAGPTVERRDITSRASDPDPLTVEVVFPSKEIPAAEPDLPPYTMIGEAQADPDCRYTGDDQVKTLLGGDAQCTQFVRASFLSYDQKYFVTVGVLNLPDQASATDTSNKIAGFGQTGDGTLTGYVSDPDVDNVLFRAPPHLHMEVYGHFLVYSVVVHKDGSAMAEDDQGAKVIDYDLVQTYLINVLKDWAVVPGGVQSEQQPTTDGSATS